MKIFLLLYVPRSGSTFFADQVSRHFSQVLVLPELRLPRLLISPNFLSGKPGKDELINLVSRDHQFPALELSPGDVELCIDAMGDYSADEFLRQLAIRIAQKKNLSPQAVLYKCGSAGRRFQALRQHLPDTRLIHIYRDARAVVNSAMHTMRPYHPGQKMGRGDPWFRAQAWQKFVADMADQKDRGEPLIEVKYEELCRDPQQVLAEVEREMGIKQTATGGERLVIASAEADIHGHVGKDPLATRIDAWKDEMPRWQGLLVEQLAASQLVRRDYPIYYSSQTGAIGKLLARGYGYLYHLVATLYFHLRRIGKRLFARGVG